MVIKAEGLERAEEKRLQPRLGGKARVGRRQVWLPLDAQGRWRELLPEVLYTLAGDNGQVVSGHLAPYPTAYTQVVR